MAAMWGNMADALAPMMLSMTAGSMLGHLARRSLGQYDLPIPCPPSDELVIVGELATFGEQWSLPTDDLRLRVLHEVAHHTILGVPHIGGRCRRCWPSSPRASRLMPADSVTARRPLLRRPVVADGAPGHLRRPAGAPRRRVPDAQREPRPAGGHHHGRRPRRLGDGPGRRFDHRQRRQLSEALRRRRVEADASDRFVEQLLGLELTQASYDRGSAFVEGVVERAGPEGLEPLWASARNLPTPNDVDAPGLWLARIELPEE